MTVSPQGYQNTINTMLAASRLQEIHDANTTRGALQLEAMQKKAADTAAVVEKNRQALFSQKVEQQFGQKPSAETAPFTAEAEALFAPGAQVNQPLASSMTRSPSGYPIGGMVTAPPGPEQINKAFQEGDVRSRGEVRKRVLSVAPDAETNPIVRPILQNLMEQSQTPIASQVPGRIAEGTGLAEKQLDIGKKAEEVRTLASTARKSEATEADVIAQSQIKTATDRENLYKAQFENAQAPLKAALEHRKNELEVLIKEGQVKLGPVQYEQAVATLAKTNQEIQKADFDYRKAVQVQSFMERALREPPGPKRDKYLDELSVVQGHDPLNLRKLSVEMQNASLNALSKAIDIDLKAREEAKKGTPEGNANADMLGTQANNFRVAASEIKNEPVVTLTKVVPTTNILGNVNGAQVGNTEVPTWLGRAYTDGKLDEAIRNKTGLPTPDGRVMEPWQVIESKIRIEYAYAKNDTKILAEAINKLNANPPDKEKALQNLMKPNPFIKNTTTQEQQAPLKGVGAPGLSVSGTAAKAAELPLKGLEKLAPYDPMRFSTGR